MSFFEIVLVRSLCSQCLRGDKNAEPFHHGDTENTENRVGREIRTVLQRPASQMMSQFLAFSVLALVFLSTSGGSLFAASSIDWAFSFRSSKLAIESAQRFPNQRILFIPGTNVVDICNRLVEYMRNIAD